MRISYRSEPSSGEYIKVRPIFYKERRVSALLPIILFLVHKCRALLYHGIYNTDYWRRTPCTKVHSSLYSRILEFFTCSNRTYYIHWTPLIHQQFMTVLKILLMLQCGQLENTMRKRPIGCHKDGHWIPRITFDNYIVFYLYTQSRPFSAPNPLSQRCGVVRSQRN